MKPIHLITAFAFASFAWILSSCCSDDKHCAAGSSALGTLPYTAGQTIVFADSADNKITVRLTDEPDASEAYTAESSCSFMHKEEYCESSIGIRMKTISDSTGILTAQQRYFHATLSKAEEVGVTGYSLGAFGGVNIGINDYGAANTVYNAIQLDSFVTPFHTYTNVYVNDPIILYPGMQGKKYVFTRSGKLISFSIPQDSTHIFYLVE